MMPRSATLLILLSLAVPAAAAPSDAETFAWQTHPGAQTPPGVALREADGRTTELGRLFGGPPIILDLGYFHCPALCGLVRADLLAALRGSALVEGRDYALVSLSIDPAETPADAARAKATDLADSPFATGADWHYMTGQPDAIAAVEAVVGFRSRYDPDFEQFMHPAGLVVLTRTGIVSSYLLGLGYHGGDLRAAVLRASEGGVAQAALPVLLLCFHYDAATGRYTLAIEKLLRLLALLTAATLAGTLLVLHRHGPKPP